MSFWDNVKKLTQSYGDEEYDEEEEYDGEEYFDEEEPAPRPVRRAAEPAKDFNMSAPSKSESGSFSGKVLNMHGNKPAVVLFRPTSFNDATKAADDLRDKKAVIVNLENVDKAISRRVIDFLSGCAYALDGTVNKIALATYLFCPHNMEVMGDLESLQSEAESYV
jgi:cell division inhibitor SepF